MSSSPKQQDIDDESIHGVRPPRFEAESITSTSEDGQSGLHVTESSGSEIGVYRVGIPGDRRLVSSADESPAYFVRTSIFRRGIPDVTMFAGSDKNGAVVGVCNFAAFSHSVIVGRGDPAKPNEVEWETVAKTSRDHSTYQISIGWPKEQRKSYVWKRTHDPNVKGTKSSKLDRRSWKLMDDATGQLLAVFASTGVTNLKKAGTFRFLTSEGKDWEEWMLLTCMGLYEKARRRAMARRDLSWFI